MLAQLIHDFLVVIVVVVVVVVFVGCFVVIVADLSLADG